MDLLIFAALVVSMDILLVSVIAVAASKWLDKWMLKKEDTYLYGHQEKESK